MFGLNFGHVKSPLEIALDASQALKAAGIRPTDHHWHIGENATRCEFCDKPVEARVHDPKRLGRGTD
jgi:hypothetical protein